MKRTVTSIDWSPKISELLLVSYSKCKEWRVDEADGLIHLHSLALRNKPEVTLSCQYEVTKAMFNPFNPNVVLGASYSGYVMMWDIRAKTTPVQKTCAAKNGHNHPIYSLAVIGSPNAHNIVSVSNDGRLCTWAPGMFNEPKKYIDLKNN